MSREQYMDVVLDALKKLWLKYPELRIGQFFMVLNSMEVNYTGSMDLIEEIELKLKEDNA